MSALGRRFVRDMLRQIESREEDRRREVQHAREALRDAADELPVTEDDTTKYGALALVKQLTRIIASEREPTARQAALIDILYETAKAAALGDEPTPARPLPDPIRLTVKQLGAVLGKHEPKAVKRWLAKHKIQPAKGSRTIRVLVVDLERHAWREWTAARRRYETGEV